MKTGKFTDTDLCVTEANEASHASKAVAQYLKTAHFQQRQAQRKITDQIVALTVSRGRRFYEGNETVYFLRRRDLPAHFPPEVSRRADGTVVVVGIGGALLTTYRNPLYLRSLKHRQN